MGGTTAKFCVIDRGQPLIAHEFEVDRRYRLKKGSGLPIKLPVIEMIEIGAGGGSIARIDPMGLLKVGPESAGAEPGPVCYGYGGAEPTVTDADLVLGYLDPHSFLTAPLAFDFVRYWPGRIDHLDWQEANALLREMEAEGQALLEKSGVLPEQISHQRVADIRYVGQGHEIQVPLPVDQLSRDSVSTIINSFEEVYRRLYERISQSVPVEIIN